MGDVTEKLCDDRHGNSCKRLDKHSEEIDDLKAAVLKLTYIIDEMQKGKKAETTKPWQTKWFEWVIKSVCVIAVLITMAAIGVNYFKEYIAMVVK